MVETCRKHGDMILRYLLIKTAAKLVSKMSSACGNCQVESQARATVTLLNVLTSRKVHLFNYSISQVSYVHSPRTRTQFILGPSLGQPMNRFTFVYFRKPKHFRAQMPTSTSKQSLKDISYDQNFFAKICRRNFEISELKK